MNNPNQSRENPGFLSREDWELKRWNDLNVELSNKFNSCKKLPLDLIIEYNELVEKIKPIVL